MRNMTPYSFFALFLFTLNLAACSGFEDLPQYEGAPPSENEDVPEERADGGSDPDPDPVNNRVLSDDSQPDPEGDDFEEDGDVVIIAGDVKIESQLDMAALEDVDVIEGNLHIAYRPVSRIDLPELKQVGGLVTIAYLLDLQVLRLPNLRHVGSLNITGNPITSFDLRSLERSLGEVKVVNNESLPECFGLRLQEQVDASEYDIRLNLEGCQCEPSADGQWYVATCE